MKHKIYLLIGLLLSSFSILQAEDGSRLWLRQPQNAHAQVTANKQSPTIGLATRELQQAWQGAPVTLELKRTSNWTKTDSASGTLRTD